MIVDDVPSTFTNQNAHMIKYNLLGVILFSPGGQLPKVIHQGSHAWGEVQHTIDQLPQRDPSCNLTIHE